MVCCRLVSRSAVGLGEKWNGRIVFGDMMQSERGLFAMFVAIKNGVKNARIFVEKVPCFKVQQKDNGCQDFHTIDVTQHEKNNHHLLCIVLSSKIEINFTHADVEWLTEILNSVVTTCSLKIS